MSNNIELIAKFEELKVLLTRQEQKIDVLTNQVAALLDHSVKKAAAKNVTPVDAPKAKKTVVTNVTRYFSDNYKKSPDFQKKYTTPEIEKLIAADADIAKTTAVGKKTALIATLVFKYIKEKNPEAFKQLNAEFDHYVAESKKEEEAGIQKPEDHTDDEKTDAVANVVNNVQNPAAATAGATAAATGTAAAPAVGTVPAKKSSRAAKKPAEKV